jgi:hypothetical protein
VIILVIAGPSGSTGVSRCKKLSRPSEFGFAAYGWWHTITDGELCRVVVEFNTRERQLFTEKTDDCTGAVESVGFRDEDYGQTERICRFDANYNSHLRHDG